MKSFSGDYAQEIAFPLSGIGTGGLSISGIGQLIDWEPDGRANKESCNEYSHFALKAERNGRLIDAKVLQGDKTAALSGSSLAAHHQSWGYGQGPNRTTLTGFSHFSSVSFTGDFPFARLQYAGEGMPARAELMAYNPFIPGDEDNSSLPAAFFCWTVTNTAAEPTDYTLAASVGNPFRISDGGYDIFTQQDGLSSIVLGSKNYTPDQIGYGQMIISTDCPEVSYQEYWYRSGWFDDLTAFWRDFTAPGKLKNRRYVDDNRRGAADNGDMCTLAAHFTLQPGESKELRFVLSWYFPRFVKYWDDAKPSWNHEYVRRFTDAGAVRDYCFANRQQLYARSAAFRDAMNRCTLPEEVRDAAVSNLCVLKSPTCLRLEDGSFYAFEGTVAHNGSCEGTCDHVWGYQYALPFLFPRMARRTLEIDYTYNLRPTGELMFRTMLPLGSEPWPFRACVDGQMGCILRYYREWKLCGDDAWLKRWWPSVKKTLAYAWSKDNHDRWDPDKSGVLTGRQHHTLDVELFGPSAWLNGYYLAALKAAAEIADYLSEPDTAAEYRSILASGQSYLEKELFNGRHYIQKTDLKNRALVDQFTSDDASYVPDYWNDETQEMKYQIGEGSEIDQMVAQWHASLIGLGDVFDPAHRRVAAENLYRLNFKSMRNVNNPCRIFAANDEKGMVICAWDPDSYQPKIPLPYTEECMTGFEYAAAGLLMQEGMVEEGLQLVRAIRDRYDGKKRNPFAEIECGSSYARSMASFALPAVLSGYRFDMVKKEIGFSPLTGQLPYTAFWTVDSGWGNAEITENEITLTVLHGSLSLKSYLLPEGWQAEQVTVICDGEPVAAQVEKGRVIAEKEISVSDTLIIRKNITKPV